ncbi:hypothetical protein HPB47_013195 [Ixodes persulcatus]|uniref:Uncharacterized protein n=1 Tax=Ixodes persulcatus TaxID=34615 RepID=A0AC60QZ93_IXOPE|nr:hypothetical protein HPB47_013195 [Ixodes persulcatus]
MLEDTMIAFSSDNGGLPYGAYSNRGFNWPLRGAKFTLWEGGVRVPAFVWSSKFLKKPRVSDQLMHITDWLPTLYSAAGGNVSNLGSIDGIDMWRYLTLGFGSGRKEVLLTIDPLENLAGLRYKNYKLVVGEGFDEELDGRYSLPGGLRPTNDVPQLRKDSRVARRSPPRARSASAIPSPVRRPLSAEPETRTTRRIKGEDPEYGLLLDKLSRQGVGEPTLTYAAVVRRPPPPPRTYAAPPGRQSPAPQYDRRHDDQVQYACQEPRAPRKTDVWRMPDRRPL